MSVSYLISSYNKASYLGSVLKTTHSELQETDGEIIILDDGSKDDSWSLITDFARSDDRISIYRQQNLGIFNVTNQLLALAKCGWFRLIDCDDPLISGSTMAQLRLAQTHEADYVFGTMIPYGPEPLSTAEIRAQDYAASAFQILEDPLLYAITGYNHVPTAALVSRKALNSSQKLPEDLISCQDLAVALNVFQHGRVVRLEAPVCWQLVGVTHRLSSREALTFHQTIEILRRFGHDHFTPEYKRIALRKVLSRSMRWMRRNAMVRQHPATFASLVSAYLSLKAGFSLDWDSTMRLAAVPLARDVDDILRGRKMY